MEDALPKFVQAILEGDDDRAEALVATLDQNATPGLQAMLSDANSDLRWWAVRALAALNADPQAIAAMLDDRDGEVRACAALALAHGPCTSTPQAETMVDALVAHLADPNPHVGNLCALALCHIGSLASPALVRALEENPQNVAVRIRAARALSSVAAPEAIPALIHALDDESTLVQYYAEDALERLGVGIVLFKP